MIHSTWETQFAKDVCFRGTPITFNKAYGETEIAFPAHILEICAFKPGDTITLDRNGRQLIKPAGDTLEAALQDYKKLKSEVQQYREFFWSFQKIMNELTPKKK